MTIKKNYSFNVDITSKQDERRYQGTFHMRRPDIGDLGAISAAMSRMNQGENYTSSQFEVVMTAIATVTICGEDVPKWWAEITDENAVADTRVILRVGAEMVKGRDKAAPFRDEGVESPSDSVHGAGSSGR